MMRFRLQLFIVLGNTDKISCFLPTFALQKINFTVVNVRPNMVPEPVHSERSSASIT